MKTKIYIKYIPVRKRAWRYASMVVPKTFPDLAEAQDYLEWSGSGNIHIDGLTYEFGGLEDWVVIEMEEVAESVDLGLTHNDKAQVTKEAEAHTRKLKRLDKQIKKTQKETAKFNAIAKKESERTVEIKVEIESLKNDSIQFYIKEFGLTEEEAKFAEKNTGRYLKQTFFKVTPSQVRREYAESFGGEEAEKRIEEIRKGDNAELRAESKQTADYIKVFDKYVPAHLYYDYIVHLNKEINQRGLESYEARRCLLHQRIYDVFGGDRVSDRDSEFGIAIDRVVSKIQSCAFCGHGVSSKNICISCGVQNNLTAFLNNFNKLKTVKK